MTKILVIQNKRIGDVLISSVIANNIKKIFPDSHVTYFVYDYTTGVIENNPNIDRIITANDKELKKFPKLLKTIAAVKKEEYDIIFDSYAKFQSRLLCLFSGAKYRIGFKRAHKELKFPFYTHPVNFLDDKSQFCGKAIEDRLNIINSVFPLENPDDRPKIHLTEAEKNYNSIVHLKKPVIMFTVLGSTLPKSMPFDYVAELIDYITDNYSATILFNYAPHQKEDALKIYEFCKNKEQINLDIYEDSIRGFIKLMYQCDLLIANEGGTVHITKALGKPTFTIYSPYIEKGDWNSFEDGIEHDSVHLLEEKPQLFEEFTRESRKVIEENPEQLYRELTPKMILSKLKPFLANHLKNAKK
ncbi:glycosyltransferase family 9 protein [Ulvibacter antarcticus]|uniref:Heptosyltransferase-2 n=1 Tax=Ulvibacter antarcticus TaxID=442714 RepID=A0A3L9YKN9_9FLAO|nr:glycosyltransferase family 9 protein [Ulvibacter antarcticus]RMA58568.1 heptosyltransferase-2 [Ulvibacter antarcticus]